MLQSPERQLTVLSVSRGWMSVRKVLVEILFLLFLSLSYLIRQDLPAAGTRGNRFPVHLDLRGGHGACPNSRWRLRRLWIQQTISKGCQNTVWVPTRCVSHMCKKNRARIPTSYSDTVWKNTYGTRKYGTHSYVTTVETRILHLWFYLGINMNKKQTKLPINRFTVNQLSWKLIS